MSYNSPIPLNTDPDVQPPMKAFLTEWNPLSSATATEDQELFSLVSDPDDFELAEDNVEDLLDEVNIGGQLTSAKENEGSMNVPALEKEGDLKSMPLEGESVVPDEIVVPEPSKTPIPKIAVTGDDNGEVDLALEELVMTMVNEVITESVEKASIGSSVLPEERENLETCTDEGKGATDATLQQQSHETDGKEKSVPSMQYVDAEKGSDESSTLPEEMENCASKSSCSEKEAESRDPSKESQTQKSDEMVMSSDKVVSERSEDDPQPLTKMAMQDVEVVGQDALSKEVLFEVATMSVEEKEEEQTNRVDSVTVDKPLTQVEAEEFAEGEECADLVAQAKEVDNGPGGEVVDRDEKERKQSQVCSLLWEKR